MTKALKKQPKTESIAETVKQPKTKKQPKTENAAEAVVTLPRKRMPIRSGFDMAIGSRLGNRMVHFNSFWAGAQTTPDAELAAMDIAKTYDPRAIGKRHDSKNVATFDRDRAEAIRLVLDAREDIGATRLSYASGMYSVWFAFKANNQ